MYCFFLSLSSSSRLSPVHIRKKRGTECSTSSAWGPRNNLVRKIQIQPSPRITRERLFLFSCLTLKFPRFQVTRSKHNASICNMSVTRVAPNDVAKVHIFYETVKQCPYYFVAGRGGGGAGRCLSHKGRTSGATHCLGLADALSGLSDKGGTRGAVSRLSFSAGWESC